MTRVCQVALLLCLTGAGIACSTGYKPYACVVGPEGLDPDPHLIWDCNRRIMKRAAKGKGFTLHEFREAAAFFERLTSIEAGAPVSEYGPLPPKDLKRRLVEWDRWYDAHGATLVWDPRTGTVRSSDGG